MKKPLKTCFSLDPCLHCLKMTDPDRHNKIKEYTTPKRCLPKSLYLAQILGTWIIFSPTVMISSVLVLFEVNTRGWSAVVSGLNKKRLGKRNLANSTGYVWTLCWKSNTLVSARACTKKIEC